MKMLRGRSVLLLALGIFFSFNARAEQCAWNTAKDFYSCDNFGIWQSVGRSFSTQTEILSISPEALPAMPTPAGVEGTLSHRTDNGKAGRAQVSLIKGFQGFGFGVSTLDVGTFNQVELGSLFMNNATYKTAYGQYKDDSSLIRGSQLGFSVMPPLGPISRLLHLQAGASVAKGNSTGRYLPSYGVSADFQFVSFGYSVSRQAFSNSLPEIRSSIWNVGLQLTGLYVAVAHSIFHSTAGGLHHTSYSLRWSGPHLNFYLAAKSYFNEFNQAQMRFHATAEGKVNSHLSAGYMYGLYRDSHSLFAQLFF